MAQAKAHYETVMIFSLKNGEEGVNALVEKFHKLIGDNGTINNIDTWGQRPLAYPINDENVGYYSVVDFTTTPDFPAELDRIYKITDGVLRSLIIAKEGPYVKKEAPAAPAQPEVQAAVEPSTEE